MASLMWTAASQNNEPLAALIDAPGHRTIIVMPLSMEGNEEGFAQTSAWCSSVSAGRRR